MLVTRQDRRDYQLSEWISGRPHHNAKDDECVPDFSCCTPCLLAPKEIREQFRDAGPAKRAHMLMVFLGAMLSVKLGDNNVEPIIDGYSVKKVN